MEPESRPSQLKFIISKLSVTLLYTIINCSAESVAFFWTVWISKSQYVTEKLGEMQPSQYIIKQSLVAERKNVSCIAF